MDTTVTVDTERITAAEELYKAIHHVEDVIITREIDETTYHLQGSSEGFQELREQLSEQEAEEEEYEQYEFAEANKVARKKLVAALRNDE